MVHMLHGGVPPKRAQRICYIRSHDSVEIRTVFVTQKPFVQFLFKASEQSYAYNLGEKGEKKGEGEEKRERARERNESAALVDYVESNVTQELFVPGVNSWRNEKGKRKGKSMRHLASLHDPNVADSWIRCTISAQELNKKGEREGGVWGEEEARGRCFAYLVVFRQ